MKIGLLGLGTVGTGVYEILADKKRMIEECTNTKIEITKILVKNLKKDRSIQIKNSILTDNPLDILEDPEIDIVVEVMGGIKESYKYIKVALENGKHVVTANKAVLSEYLYEFNSIARKNNRAILFEASVAGGIPVIKALTEMINLNKITEIRGILNGTTNFILSKMTEEGMEFCEALKLAQNLGYAEADPTDDIEGYDAARKIAILSSIAFDHKVNFDDIECSGITSISSLDIAFLKKIGIVVKLIGSASVLSKGFNAQVEPVLIDQNSIMANVENSNNIVSFNGNIVGELQFYGQGAGKEPTANAVVSDIIDIVNKKYKYINFENKEKKMKTIKATSNYYFRAYLNNKEDEFNILKQITKLGIIFEVLQRNKVLILILKNISMENIKKLAHDLGIEDQYCYIKIDNSQVDIIHNLISENFNRFAI